MPILVIFLLAIVAAAAWLANGWVVAHGVAELVDGKWALEASGWSAVGVLAGAFLVIGGIFGGLLGFMAGSRLWRLVEEHEDLATRLAREQLDAERKKLEAVRRDLERRKWEIDGQVSESIAEARQAGLLRAERAEQAARQAQRKTQGLEGRLKGAQQKAVRMKRRADQAQA